MRRVARPTVIALTSLLLVSGCGTPEVLDEQPSDRPASETTVAPTATTAPEATVGEAESDVATETTWPTAPTVRPPLVEGLPAPDITLELDDETTLCLTEAYEPVVLFFWATWCHNCHEMMPVIDEMAVDYQGSASVVAVARLSGLHEIENDVIEYLPSGATRWVSDDDNSISESMRIPGNPVTILVVGGVETDRWLGLASVDDIRARLDEVLDLYE